jgi:hypothetical protein
MTSAAPARTSFKVPSARSAPASAPKAKDCFGSDFQFALLAAYRVIEVEAVPSAANKWVVDAKEACQRSTPFHRSETIACTSFSR